MHTGFRNLIGAAAGLVLIAPLVSCVATSPTDAPEDLTAPHAAKCGRRHPWPGSRCDRRSTSPARPARPGLGPGHRAETSVLQAWVEFARTGSLHPHTAARIGRLGAKRNHGRLFAMVPRELVECTRSHLSGDLAASFDETLSGVSHLEMRPRPRLTDGELRVLRALAVHPTIAAIAAALHVSPNTIKSQLQSLYRKLGCSTREEAIQIASRLRLRAAVTDPRAVTVPGVARLGRGA